MPDIYIPKHNIFSQFLSIFKHPNNPDMIFRKYYANKQLFIGGHPTKLLMNAETE